MPADPIDSFDLTEDELIELDDMADVPEEEYDYHDPYRIDEWDAEHGTGQFAPVMER